MDEWMDEWINSRVIITPDFKLYARAVVTKIMWDWCRYKHTDHLSRTEDPGISPCTYSCLFWWRCQDTDFEKTSLTNSAGKNRYRYTEEWHDILLFPSIQKKWRTSGSKTQCQTWNSEISRGKKREYILDISQVMFWITTWKYKN